MGNRSGKTSTASDSLRASRGLISSLGLPWQAWGHCPAWAPKHTILHLFWLNCIRLGAGSPPSGCFLSLARSFRILLLSSRVFVATLSLLSSGDIISTLSRPSPKSLVKILSSTGHWANPRGASLDSCAWFDSEPSVIALCVSQRVIQAAQCPEDTHFHHWPVTASCGTGSKSVLYLGLIYPLILLPCCRRKLDGLDVICSQQNYTSCQASPWFCSPADCSQLVSGTKVELAASCCPLPFWIGTLFAFSLQPRTLTSLHGFPKVIAKTSEIASTSYPSARDDFFWSPKLFFFLDIVIYIPGFQYFNKNLLGRNLGWK